MSNSYEAKNVLGLIVQAFKEGNLPEAIKLSYIEDPDPNKPMKKYSLCNRFLIHLQGTKDARGSNQWKEVEREVDYSKHPYKVHILKPNFSIACRKCSEGSYWGKQMTFKGKIGRASKYVCSDCGLEFLTNQEDRSKIKQMLTGFSTIYLYKVEDTTGKPLPTHKPKKLPCLFKVGEKWNIPLSYDGSSHGEYGYTTGEKIVLCSEDESVYAHELMHVADFKNNKKINGQDPTQEIVAELGSCVIMEIFGMDKEKKYKSFTYDYIKRYTMNKDGTEKTKEEIAKICLKVLGRIEKALDEIFKTYDEIQEDKKKEEKPQVIEVTA